MTEPPDCEPNWRDTPDELDALCQDGARQLYGPAVAARDVDTVDLQGRYL